MVKRHSALDANYLPGSYSLERKISLKFKEFSNLQLIQLASWSNTLSKTENFYTSFDGQEGVECEVTEANSAETDREFVNVLWTGELELPGGRDKGQKVEVTYSFTDNQVMKCSFLDVASNKKTEIDLNIGKYGVSDVEGEELDIDQFTIE